ncbi:hypothetical protein [Mucilaginibacter sp. L3T2-6]|uniref:hypothetical protein n=1 Tax=Mucilaginibacter sp. L3T2-6 TaxID=3062491 RepID=UPI002676340B|nr:hypothetical protein [Mucilaginibacter sp. L3T2-6]MDO3641958.1 hypothetical protein [Mucilaginibacter sp. L3T2-6]MDV6214364.1 hypothetical protein [Mucilaginibacter sp. L3T2-6]
MTPKQIGMVRGLLAKAGLTQHKEDMVYDYTNGRTEHLSEMTHDETQALVKYLNSFLGQTGNPAEKMRRKILSMAHEMHWELPGTTRVDMKRVNNWCIRFSGQNKPLDAFKYSELPALVSQFEIVYRDFLKGI